MGLLTCETKYNLIHGSFLLMNIVGFAWYWQECRDFHYLFKYFSIQAFQLAILYSITSLFNSTKDSRMNQILHELSLTSNLAVCLGYWIIVRITIVGRIPNSFLICNDFIHTMPIIMISVINYFEHLEYFQMKNIKYQAYFMTFASAVNIFYTFWQGPVYTFMKYQDLGTAIFLAGGFGFLLLVFVLMNKLSVSRSKKVPKTNQKNL